MLTSSPGSTVWNIELRRPPELPFVPQNGKSDSNIRVCIIGAGISGLYLGMLLDELDLKNVSYDILESNERTGGRVYTYKFGPGKMEYYDVGAMRFPRIPPLARTFDLFMRCGAQLIPYNYGGEQCPNLFNTIGLAPGNEMATGHDPFKFSVSEGGLVPDMTVMEGPDGILKRAFDPFISGLADNFTEGFDELMKWDHLTTRDYLNRKMGLDFYSIWYLETVSSASGLYDQSLSEAVLDAMDFDYPTTTGAKVEWYSVKGGTSEVVKNMEKRLSRKPALGHRVVSLSYEPASDPDYPMLVQVDGETQPRSYSAVFNTASLPCLRRMNVGEGILSPGQKAAVQSIHYDASTKIAIRFKSAWWRKYCNIQGGQATTDLPIRVCVYPSASSTSSATEGEEEDTPTVLLCSYTWGQDAQQLASLVNSKSESARRELKQLLTHNLTLLHQEYLDAASGLPYGYARMLHIILDEYDSFHGYDWYSDPACSGAFAYFGPGQFKNFYPELVKPAANGHLFLVGEACSAHHAWISGSLDSAYRALLQLLYKLKYQGRLGPDVLERLQTVWGTLDEIPPEVLEWQAFLAMVRETSPVTGGG
ncbi:uncharacterized protein BHQ10_001223 [Talaromyces amestolkiae]|uniref:Amine oxidase domain-containing protein n=1 Tax=Talaromyces amestolkiae TaxID=1196081 RepID=A0A364KNX9_TALAM|nr:uncharacterized protein BHQ10_001223 [Talaromyces amestolkiae]RAO65211.1 hypothetical protein BHQ10_001223 [Talaromyces amestolkiae]